VSWERVYTKWKVAMDSSVEEGRRELVKLKYPGLAIDELPDLVIYCLLFGHMPPREEEDD